MGWTGLTLPAGKTRKAYLDEALVLTAGNFGQCVLASAMVGTTYYAAVERIFTDGQPREVPAAVILTRGGDRSWSTNFTYKDMDEGMGPVECACPLAILKLLTPTETRYANDWRARVRAFHEREAALKRDVRPGARLRFAEPIEFRSGVKRQTLRLLSGSTFEDERGSRFSVTGWRSSEFTILPAGAPW